MNEVTPNKEDVYDVIIIGGGPAGLTAAIYTTRAGLSTILIEKLGTGGQAALTDKVENYPGFIGGVSGPELVHSMDEQAKSFGMITVSGQVTGLGCSDEDTIKRVYIDDHPEPYKSLSVIIAAGHEQRKLGVPGEDKYTGRGVSYCATCDGAFFRDLSVAVIGGGDVAVEDGLFLTKFASKVYLIHRRDRLRATKILQERVVRHDKIELILDSVVDEIFGEAMVQGVRVRNLKTGEITELKVDGAFVFIGWTPSLSFLGDAVERSDDGYIITDTEMRTSREGVFACGDCCKKELKQIVTACGDGATAAFSAQHYVERIKGEEYV
ncbi:MAG: thioredoxin-disulfide reductase [Deltaproteobacteria bacterium]|nr:thioredoxin-disulfide reductase [Deltaproteobacteria bacterium]